MKKMHSTHAQKVRTVGRGRVNMAKVEATTEADIERHAREDGEEEWTPDMMRRAHMFRPTKRSVTIRLDPDIVDFFEHGGRGYQSRINAVLRSYVDTQKRRAS